MLTKTMKLTKQMLVLELMNKQEKWIELRDSRIVV